MGIVLVRPPTLPCHHFPLPPFINMLICDMLLAAAAEPFIPFCLVYNLMIEKNETAGKREMQATNGLTRLEPRGILFSVLPPSPQNNNNLTLTKTRISAPGGKGNTE